jgi:hypothetical protein
MTAKATIESFQTPVTLGHAAQVKAKVTQGHPDKFRWQYLTGGSWKTAGEVPATSLTYEYLFPAVGQYPIRLQTIVAGNVTDTTGTPRTIVVLKNPDPPQPPTKTVFRAFRGQYVCDDDTNYIAVNRPTPVQQQDPNWKPGAWETFTKERQPDGRVAYKSDHGTYVTAVGGGGGAVTCTSLVVLAAQCFTEEPRPNGGFACRTDNGHYLCADYNEPLPDGCELNATRTSAGDYETFYNANPVPPPPEPGKARTGIVHVEGAHGTADDQGRHYFGGTTLFWGPWAYRMDRGKLHTNLTTLAPGQLDFIRPLCHVIEPADFWGPRANDLTVPDNVVKLGDYVDECYSEFGLRQHLTIFGDTSYTRPIRSKIVDDVIAIMRPRLERIFCFEVVNEAELLKPTPFPVDEAKEYAVRLKQAFPQSLVFVSSPVGDLCDAQQRIAGDTGSSGIGPHYSRSTTGTKGVWTPVTQPWMGDGRFCSHVGPLIVSGEPIGPNSSGTADSDPTRLATMILVGGVGGLCADVFHTGTGVRGIDDPARGIPADFSGIPNLAEILEAERQARALLNQFPDMPDWSRGSSTDGPFTIKTWPDDSHGVKGTLDRAYSSWSGAHSLTACCNIHDTTTFTAKKAMHVSVRHARRALDEIVSIDLAAGQSFTLDASTPGAAIVGTF